VRAEIQQPMLLAISGTRSAFAAFLKNTAARDRRDPERLDAPCRKKTGCGTLKPAADTNQP
jgi:hypothetical protein